MEHDVEAQVSQGREVGKLYQDQLYGAKVLSPLAVAIMDCPEYERLANLRQLGFANRVYRAAEHTRFAHSVGTYFISRTILRRIAQNHERMGLPHPGKMVAERFRTVPPNSDVDKKFTSYQACWRGVAEVVSAAALLHDLGHVPFAHTLEDEFTGIYPRHDRVGGPRLYQMLFHESSELARVFSNQNPIQWLAEISNEELRRLIYVILSWKEDIDERKGFQNVLNEMLEEVKREGKNSYQERLAQLKDWHSRFSAEGMFHPFMSDVIGNTICADILDYLPRDCANLGMEVRRHDRLQRYFTIRNGDLYPPEEGLRMSIMVTRKGHGGQRRDVTSEVLNIMRERYEMAERVYYHHKKAAASSMLAKLTELADEARQKPRDDEHIYPAPWTVVTAETGDENEERTAVDAVPHMAHLSDYGLIDYLGTAVELPPEKRALQTSLHRALRYRRDDSYRTLMVIDTDLVGEAGRDSLVTAWRGSKAHPDSSKRRELEAKLAEAAGAREGDVIIFCPAADMQSKEVDVRLELSEGKVYPLRTQQQSFAYRRDVETLQHHYKELWRAYIFVAPDLFARPEKCKAVVDVFCTECRIPSTEAYTKVRTHDFEVSEGVRTRQAFQDVSAFLKTLPFPDPPLAITYQLLEVAAVDKFYLELIRSGSNTQERLSTLLDASVLGVELDSNSGRFKGRAHRAATAYRAHLVAGGQRSAGKLRLEVAENSFAEYAETVFKVAEKHPVED